MSRWVMSLSDELVTADELIIDSNWSMNDFQLGFIYLVRTQNFPKN